MIKRFRRKQENKRRYRTNEFIFSNTLRVIDSSGKQIGILSKLEALSKARMLGLDLVEIAPNANPPVVKIIDFKKFLYQEEKKKREEKRKSKTSETKELRLGPFMNEHDLMVIIKKAREFIGDGNKVKFVVKFAGRQIAHPEFGENVLTKAINSLSDVSRIEREKHFEGRQLIAIISPDRKGGLSPSHAKAENKKIGK